MISTGTDAPTMPWAKHWELEQLVEAGLSPKEGIDAATGVAARILGAEGEIGTVAEGTWADLVVLDANPLEDIRNTQQIWLVIKGGVIVDRGLLHEQPRAGWRQQ